MANTNFGKTTTTDLTNAVPDYVVPTKVTDGNYAQKENKWTNTNAAKYYGFYYGVGEYRTSINSFVRWVIGQGFVTTDKFKLILDNIDGFGEDTFLSIIFNHLCVKKFNGDAYALIKRNEKTGTLINLIPLDPRRMTHITNSKGRIQKYEYQQGDGKLKEYSREEIFHSVNDRILDEPHGTSVTSAVEWVINKILQAREDYARIMHVSSVRILYVDENDTTRQNLIKVQYAEGLKNHEVMMITCKPEDAKFQDLLVPPADAWIRYLEHLEDKFYKALGVPKVVLGGTADNTEASAKVGVIAYEPIWTMEIAEIEADIFSQLGIELKFNKQPSLMDNMQTDEAKNTGQTKLEFQGSQ